MIAPLCFLLSFTFYWFIILSILKNNMKQFEDVLNILDYMTGHLHPIKVIRICGKNCFFVGSNLKPSDPEQHALYVQLLLRQGVLLCLGVKNLPPQPLERNNLRMVNRELPVTTGNSHICSPTVLGSTSQSGQCMRGRMVSEDWKGRTL